ncbi:MAG: hypothetical protein J7647_09240 [Cyanobacteria bacterium SBLK]|nr:hypothetical protein [Cyanobacteria bacterium SBLK]
MSPNPEKAPSTVGRRNFLALGMGAIAGLAWPQKATGARNQAQFGTLETWTGSEFPQPPVANLGTSTQPTLIYVDPILGSTANPATQNITVRRYYLQFLSQILIFSSKNIRKLSFGFIFVCHF